MGEPLQTAMEECRVIQAESETQPGGGRYCLITTATLVRASFLGGATTKPHAESTTNIGPLGTRATGLVSLVVVSKGAPFLGVARESSSCTVVGGTLVCIGFTMSCPRGSDP